MGLESATYTSDLVATNPTSSDPKSQGDDHIRLLKATIQATLPNLTGAMVRSHTELNTVTARGLIAGQTWTGTHQFPSTTYGVTAAFGATGTGFATLDFVNAVATNAALPGQTSNAGKLLSTDGTTASWGAKLLTGVIRWADSSDQTKLTALDLTAVTTGTTRTLVVPDRNVTLGYPYLKVSDQKVSGTNAGTSLSSDITQTRTLNTVEVNTIPGASLATNTVTLGAGTYQYLVRAPAQVGNGHKAFLYNSSDSAYVGIGSNSSSSSSAAVQTDSIVSGQFTISGSKNFTVRHYTAAAVSTTGLGLAITSGQVEVYTVAEFWQIA